MIIKRPDHNYTKYEDKLNFSLAWNLANITVLITVFLSICFFFFDKGLLIPTFGGVIISSFFLFILKVNSNYKIVAFLYALIASSFFITVFLTVTDVLHLVEYVWMFIIVIYAYAMCGKMLGSIILLLNLVGLSLHIWLTLVINIHAVDGTLTSFHLISTILTIASGFLFFGYIVSKQAEIKNNIEKDLNNSNQDLIKTNKIVAAQNKEKEVMLKEIHHRVKNNLQIIISLLRIQYNRNESPELKGILETNVTRINSIAMVHEKMYQSDNLAKINYKEYLNSLVSEIIHGFSFSKKIEYSISSDLDNIGNRTVVPLALIFNELITNSIKHAFENIDQPKIDISISCTSDGKFDLIYTDNGTWKNVAEDYNSLGLELIEVFTEQLEGTMERTFVESETKYHFSLEIID
jgi:two-component sensor histidine kinase